MPRFFNAAFVAALLLLGGCALTEGYKYDAAPVSLGSLSAPGRISLAVLDARPYVASGNKPEKFAGLMRGGYGNPFDVSTANGNPVLAGIGKPLSQVFTEPQIATALR